MIVLILARGGSKGVPGKNIKLLNGIPLIAYPIIAANKSEIITTIYVSTDSDEISDIAKKYGANIIKRPHEISGDTSLDIEGFKHFCLKRNNNPIVHLRATTPLVNSTKIDEAINYFNQHPDCDSLRSGHETSETAYKYFVKKGIYWLPLSKELNVDMPRQSLPKTFIPNGYVDIVRPSVFLKSNKLHGKKVLSFVTEFSPEIDTLEDFNYIEFLINKRNV